MVAVSGDGGFLMNSQELETARRLGTAVVSIVCTDERYGVIELNQQRRFGRTFAVEFSNPDLVKYAEAFGLPGFCVDRAEDLSAVLRRALDLDVPCIVDVPVIVAKTCVWVRASETALHSPTIRVAFEAPRRPACHRLANATSYNQLERLKAANSAPHAAAMTTSASG